MAKSKAKSNSNVKETAIREADRLADEYISSAYANADSPGALTAGLVKKACRELILSIPIRFPSAQTVHDFGNLSYGKDFPKKQTLYNHYPKILSFYRSGYEVILQKNIPDSFGPNGILAKSEISQSIDFGTRRRIELMIDIYREQVQEIRRLRNIISQSVAAPLVEEDISREARMLTDIEVQLIVAWEEKVASGTLKLEVDSLGVRVMRQAGPRPHVMTVEEYGAIKSLVRAYQDPSRSK